MTNKVKKQIKVNGKIAKLLVVKDVQFPGYYITSCGTVYAVRCKKYSQGYDYGNPREKTKTIFRNKFEGMTVSKGKNVTIFLHVAVMHTWRPVNQYSNDLSFSSVQYTKLTDDIKKVVLDGISIRHKDGNTLNNKVKNLEYCTRVRGVHKLNQKNGEAS